jgi:hypothetical protein
MTGILSLKLRTYAEIEARYACAHPERELRARIIVDGRQTFVTQCIRCGHTSSPLARKRVKAISGGVTLPPYDNGLENQWRARKSQEYDQVFKDLLPALQTECQAYLRSDAWQEKRKLVLARAYGRCELCPAAEAAEVHHRTYIRLGDEPLTDLVAVCRVCHRALHAQTAA